MCHPTPHNLTSFDCAGTPVQPLRSRCPSKQPSTLSVAVSVPCIVFLNKPSALPAALTRRWFDKFRPQQEARLLDKAQVAVPLSVFSTIFTLNRKCTSLTNPSHRFFIPRRGPRVRVPSCPGRMELAMETGGLHPGPRGGACICEAKKRARGPRAGICSYEAEKRARGPRIIE